MKSHLQTIFEDLDLELSSYSGRGMYGKSCLAVVTGDLAGFISGVMHVAIDVLDDDEYHNLADSFQNMRIDSMGLDIVYYFPEIDFVGD